MKMKISRKWRSRDTPHPLPGLPLAGPRDLTTITQTENRERRRGRLPIHYTGTFDLGTEIFSVLGPLARRPEIARYPSVVTELTTAVHQVRLDLEQLLVMRDARRRISELPYEKRKRARDLIVAAWERPECPQLSRDDIVTGTWSTRLVDHVAPITEALGEYLGRATPPGQTRGGLSISEHVEDALRELDQTILRLTRALDQSEQSRTAHEEAAVSTNTRLRQLNASREELRALGITTT